MKINLNLRRKGPRIEMLPLIDIVFLLLVFFIYAMLSMVVHRGFKVDLPQATTAEIDKEDYASITVDKNNRILLNKEEILIENLSEEVNTNIKKGIKIFINGDKEADLGVVINVLDTLRRDEIKEVYFETEPFEQKPLNNSGIPGF
ncbi:exbD/TolR family protein [Candidatus Scalindua japonica]|uniref:ExbD/TolR family protein n=1 Tax=Candidatus Scalindua japonica TaxID=1284222 RepID=A0A286U387_9BACT|nr:biopolymer transporter ExbD [Candidatus Scalindua japonica]GAX62603.1 exbD/TolR family protein [Candidatus Scalindua japonica]